jgi:Fur family ferric uptake transcriptional regulator
MPAGDSRGEPNSKVFTQTAKEDDGMTEQNWPAAVKRTTQRIRVYDILAESPVPLTAMELAAALEQKAEPVSLSTIYRILDTFTAHGMADKTLVAESGMAVYELRGVGHRHYAVCELCHKVIPMQNCPMESFLPQLAEQDFHVMGHRLQMYGYCGECGKTEASRWN